MKKRGSYLGLLLLTMVSPLLLSAIEVGTLPESQFADTEMSTNLIFRVDRAAMSRINFSVSLDASPTNCVEVSIGVDANDDGRLSVEEEDYTFGYDCGRWFVRSAISDSEVFENAGGLGRREKTFVLRKRSLDETWNLVKIVRRGCGEICELAMIEGQKPGAALILR